MLEPGDQAIDFELPIDDGSNISLRQFRDHRVVLYFYPKDDTPGCTREACDFRDNFARISAAGAVVIGVSKDSSSSHQRFRGKHGLPFFLATDADNQVARAYGAFGEKTLYGRTTTGTIRSTFLVDSEGRVQRIWRHVEVKGHVDQVLAALEDDAQAPPAPAPKRKTAKKKTAKKKTAKKKTAK